MPGFSRCRPSSRVADPGPEAKVSHHFMLLGSKMMPLPSLKLCHRMCGPTSEPKLTPHLSPAINSSNPDALESRGRPNHGLADVHFLPEPRVLPQQVGHAEVLPGRVRNLPGPRTSRPREGPNNGSPDAPRQPMLQQMAAPPRVQPQQLGLADVPRLMLMLDCQMAALSRVWPQQVGLAEVLPGRVLNLPGPRTSCEFQPSA